MCGSGKVLTSSERVKSLRAALGLSQRQLAEKFRVSPSAVAHWDSCERELSGPVLKLIEILEKKARIRKRDN